MYIIPVILVKVYSSLVNMRPACDEDEDDDDDDDDYSEKNNHIWCPYPKYNNNVITL